MGNDERPAVVIDPGVQSGRPCLVGTRVPVETIASAWWGSGESLDVIMSGWGVSRADVLVACWYVGLYGKPAWRKRLGAWAGQAHGELWYSRPDAVPLPPRDPASLPAVRTTTEYRVTFEAPARVTNFVWTDAPDVEQAVGKALHRVLDEQPRYWTAERVFHPRIRLVQTREEVQIEAHEAAAERRRQADAEESEDDG